MDVPIGCASGCNVLAVGVRVSFRGVGVVVYSSCTALAVVVFSLCVCLGVPMDVLAALAVPLHPKIHSSLGVLPKKVAETAVPLTENTLL